MIKEKKIDICLLQEVEIPSDYNTELLTHGAYKIEVEKNDCKARTAIIINENIDYIRNWSLERENYGIIVIDVTGPIKYRVINLYRSFNPQNNVTPQDFFETQLEIISEAVSTSNGRRIILAGDFNLDDSKRFANDYRHKNLFEKLNSIFDPLGLIQMLNEPTWQRVINNSQKQSILDHLYVTDPNHINDVKYYVPLIGDHKLISFDISENCKAVNTLTRRNWKSYSKQKLLHYLALENFNIETDSVQATWNNFENIIINIIDKIAPVETFFKTQHSKKKLLPQIT